MDRDQIIERERRWAVPAAVPAIAALPLYIGTFIVTSQIISGSSAADQLPSIHDHPGAMLALAVVRALALMGIAFPLAYLFRAAAARASRVQAPLIGFVFLGPALFAASTIAQGISDNQIASDFVQQKPQIQTRSYASFRHEVANNPESIDKVRLYTDSDSLDVQQTQGSFYTVKYPASAESAIQTQLDHQSVDNETDSSGAPGDLLAQKLNDDSSIRQAGDGLLIPGILAMLVAMVYTGLWATRTGLLTRFFGSLGMALGASFLLIAPVALLAMLAWLLYLGLLYLGRIPGGRPPAWETGEAMPWPKPGEEPPAPRSAGGTVDGRATEVETGDAAEASTAQQGSAKRKRKRRR